MLLNTAGFIILVNGEPSGFFKSLQGLRQGDLISPALFILASEALSRGLNHLFSQNPDMFYQTGIKTRVTHLAYADDISIFTRCEEQSLSKLVQFLDLYENQSGQKINHSKSFFTLVRRPTSLPIESNPLQASTSSVFLSHILELH
ncbi:hypothetical protein Sango_2707100 [Sesamum angolense]|uniref:Reverse transcriptase domain-containing protein n=1 Tax=Sesamum angolense TaxID=2727404 RepID=A0AAE1W303_9LAMI|nr:hypothetical protein Sango_2707100 [Sesamum angolense]